VLSTQVKKNVSQNEDVPQDMGKTKHLREIIPPKGRNLMNFQLTKFCLCFLTMNSPNTRFPLVQKKSSNHGIQGEQKYKKPASIQGETSDIVMGGSPL